MTKSRANPGTNAPGATVAAVGLGAMLVAFIASYAAAQSYLPTTRPLLEQLNHETQTLFKEIAPSIVRVQLPMPSNLILPPEDPLSKWAGKLDPDSLRRLEDLEHASPGASFATAEIRPASALPSSPAMTQQSPHIIVMRLDRVSPNSIGVVIDDRNHLLIPRYVDKAACQYPVPVSIGDGRWATAKFIASDAQADLTLLQLNPQIKTKAATISGEDPSAGTLLLVMSLNPAANRLAVWEGWEPDASALVNIDGSVAGFTKNGHFLAAAACSPVVQELMAHGFVRRAFLGVIIDVVAPDDADRQAYPALGATPALKIRQVVPGSAADHAGLHQDDLILSLAGESVGDPQGFAAVIANRRGNTEIAILRNGQKHLINVVLQGE
jgi:S1-C subfamily serine protease